MTPKEAIEKIKALFVEVPPVIPPVVAPVELEAKEYSLADGTKVKIDKLEAGGKVIHIDTAGVEVPGPTDVHTITLADGTLVTVGADGIITEVKAVEPTMPELMSKEILTQMAAFKSASDNETSKIKDELKAVKEGFKDLVALIETLVNTPSVDPLETQKSEFSEMVEARNARLDKMTEAVKNLRKK